LWSVFLFKENDLATNAEILAAIDAAIVDVLENGQEVSHDGVIYNKANINALFKQREAFTRKTSIATDTFFSRMKTGIPRRS